MLWARCVCYVAAAFQHLQEKLLLSPFYGLENQGSEQSTDLSRVAQCASQVACLASPYSAMPPVTPKAETHTGVLEAAACSFSMTEKGAKKLEVALGSVLQNHPHTM